MEDYAKAQEINVIYGIVIYINIVSFFGLKKKAKR